MASPGGNIMAIDIGYPALFTGVAAALAGTVYLYSHFSPEDAASGADDQPPGPAKSFFLFFYSCFIKPHSKGARGSQQDALESFYKTQATAYDTTRRVLLQGREDMLALAAAQLKAQTDNGNKGRIWVDVGGGTGYNIEAMSQFLNVPEFFSSVYLVDFSPSLCDVATKRFKKLGWKNVKVVCEDARTFRLSDHEDKLDHIQSSPYWATDRQFTQKSGYDSADLVTMSYSLSMIPDYYSVIDSLASLLSPRGIFGVVDFYAQSEVDFAYRNYTGGFVGRHVSFLARTFWKAWFDLDRVSLDPGRRDYLEYRFGTRLGLNCRNRSLGGIPYYIWLGVPKATPSVGSFRDIELHTKGPAHPHPVSQDEFSKLVTKAQVPDFRSKHLTTAARNLSTKLPLPTAFYQNRNWRLHYDGHLQKHLQFNDEYIYAFTWEDARVDERILKLGPDDVVLAITSAGDNILSYARQGPARIHAVDLNPAQNHLLELKVAAYSSLTYDDFWRIFGKGKHPDFRHILLTKLAPHLSSRAFQYWFENAHIFSETSGCGLYHTGGSRHALTVVRWVTKLFRCRAGVKAMLECKTLNEQREIWRARVRPALLSTLVCNAFLSQEPFLWAALGVPKNQLTMIEEDHAESAEVRGPNPTSKNKRSHAIWNYMVNTLDPIAEETHIATDNPYYYVCLAGEFSKNCHPDYLSAQTHARLSQPGALDGLRIHTDELEEVIAGMSPGTLTVAVVMDSMDWFDPGSGAAAKQIAGLNRALAMGGRVLLRSAGLAPWYLKVFEAHGFEAKRVGAREGPVCIDRVNMYASCWLCVKVGNLPPPTPEMDTLEGSDVNPLVL